MLFLFKNMSFVFVRHIKDGKYTNNIHNLYAVNLLILNARLRIESINMNYKNLLGGLLRNEF